MSSIALTLVAIIVILLNVDADEYSGPFDLDVRTVGDCPSELAGENKVNVHINTLFEPEIGTTRIVGNLSLKVAFDGRLEITALVFPWDSLLMRYRQEEPTKLPVGTVLDVANYAPKTTQSILESFEGGPWSLPLAPGNYTVNGAVTNVEIKKFPTFPYGKYSSDLIFKQYVDDETDDPDLVGCTRIFFNVVPKRG